MLQHCFKGSCFKAIDNAYPNRFKPWEFYMSPMGLWRNKKTRKEAIRWLIEERLRIKISDIPAKIGIKHFVENGLGGLLANYFNGHKYEAIMFAYPGKFKTNQFKKVKCVN